MLLPKANHFLGWLWFRTLIKGPRRAPRINAKRPKRKRGTLGYLLVVWAAGSGRAGTIVFEDEVMNFPGQLAVRILRGLWAMIPLLYDACLGPALAAGMAEDPATIPPLVMHRILLLAIGAAAVHRDIN